MTTTDEFVWTTLTGWVAEALGSVRPGQFLLIEYAAHEGWDPSPYAQCAREVDQWYCEVVSEHYLPRERWPIDEIALRRAGWLLPDDETPNWWVGVDTVERAAELMVSALRVGRGCPEPGAFTWSVGTFPSGPNGGEPVPVPVEAFDFSVAA